LKRKEGDAIATWDQHLISRIILTGNINPVIQWGITQDDFQTPEGRMLYQHLTRYFQMPETAGAVIGANALRQMYPTFQIIDDPSMTVEALCHEVRQNRCKAEMKRMVGSAAELLEVDPPQAFAMLQHAADNIRRLQGGKATDVFAEDAVFRVMEKYEMKKRGVDMSICPWPWASLQEATGGIEFDDFVVLYGRPKSMKSWVLMAIVAWCWEQGKRILIYTKEMTADNVYMRIAAIIAGVRYHEFRRGNLSPAEEHALYTVLRALRALKEAQRFVCLSGQDTGEGGDTVPWLRSKIEEHRPDICFIDGMYLMTDMRGGAKQKDNFRVQNISRDLRRTVLDTGIPIICTIQANRDAAKNADANLDEIAFSDAIGQDATLAVRVINEKHQPTLALVIGGSREFHLDGFRIYGVPATNFSDAGPLTTGELLDAQKADAPEAKKVVKRASPKTSSAPAGATPAVDDRIKDMMKE
jgi:replicative DNA helicase